jgi:hypothetical protein
VIGRTDLDTLFCEIVFLYQNSILAREVHEKGISFTWAYQDFKRNFGAPNILLRNNAQTQIGLKGITTSRNNAPKQIYTVPHNQQQTQLE